ncbi:hypothetical protein [Vibrio marisflavi]|nr:hypothetical protein [Vibrio marisflavi]
MRKPLNWIMVILAFALIGCQDKPTNYLTFQKSDIATFESQLNLSRNPDAYKTYQQYGQNDKLRDAVLAIQYKNYFKAEKILTPLAKAGEPEAMFWLAAILYGSNMYDTAKAHELWVTSAEKGNPYAALIFSPDSPICKQYYKSECSEKWEAKAKVLFKQRATSGDVRAQFYTKKLEKNHQVYIDAIIQAAKNGYLLPMTIYSNRILSNKDNVDKQSKDFAIKLLYFAADRNFIPAFDTLLFLDSTKKSNYQELEARATSLGSIPALTAKYFYLKKEKKYQEEYIIAHVVNLLSGDNTFISMDYYKNPIVKEYSQIELNKLKNIAQKKYQAINQTIYIDGDHFDDNQNGYDL